MSVCLHIFSTALHTQGVGPRKRIFFYNHWTVKTLQNLILLQSLCILLMTETIK